MTEQRTADGVQLRGRIDRYLRRRAASAGPTRASCRSPATRPTGGTSGSSRRTARRSCSRCTPDRSTSPRCRSRTSRELLQLVPLPVPAMLGHSDALGIVALQDLGDVTLQAHLGAASPAEHAALYREAVALIEQLQRRGAELALGPVPAVPHGVRRREADLGARLLRHAISSRATAAWRSARPNARRSPRSGRRSSDELAAEPRVLCHRDYHSRNLMLHDGSLLHHRLPGRADGARHLRSGVAAARFVRRHRRPRARRADRLFPRAEEERRRRRRRTTSSGGGSI